MQKIRSQYDGLLRMLIQHKELVVGGDNGDRTRLVTELMGSPGFLDLAVAAMERRDPELRQVAERQPPYDLAALGQLKSPTNLTIEPSFVDDLRRLSTSEYTDKMHSRDRTERARAAADIYSLVHLLDQLMEATPFRRKVRLLIANHVLQSCTDQVESIYRSSASVGDARAKADDVIQQKLEKIFC